MITKESACGASRTGDSGVPTGAFAYATYNGRVDRVQTEDARKPWVMGAGLVVALIAAAILALHLYAGRHYGYFVDELYYLACSRHLDWGYVDQPPLIAAIAWIAREVLG